MHVRGARYVTMALDRGQQMLSVGSLDSRMYNFNTYKRYSY